MDPEPPNDAASPSTTGINISSPHPPPCVPDYELLRCIGRGSYGDVWLARNVLGELRAIKFVYRDRFVDPRPFEREFEGIQLFEPISRSHPSQLHILHVGKNDSARCFYYVMELADDLNAERKTENEESSDSPSSQTRHSALDTPHSYAPRTLRAVLEARGRLPVSTCIEIGISLATALQHLHEQGLVHRDIKPSNVVFVKGVAKLGDIGLVTDAGDTQSIVGTEGYLPPEGPGTPQGDIYSLGKVLYEMSTGMDRRRLPELPGDLRSWSDAPAVLALNEVVLKACAKGTDDRYASVEDLRQDLERLHQGKPIQRAKLASRSPKWLAPVGIASVLIAAMIFVALVLTREKRAEQVNASDRLSAIPLAVKEYQEGVHCARRDTKEGRDQGIAHFKKAIELDPKFTMAYNGLYEIYVSKPEQPEVMECVSKMLELEPKLAEAHAALGYLSFLHWKWYEAQTHFQRAIEFNPMCAIAHMRYGFCLVYAGETEEAFRELTIAEQLNPLSPRIKKNLGHVFYVRRQFREAIAQYQKAIDIEPAYFGSRSFIGWAQRALGEYIEGIDSMERFDLAYYGKDREAAIRAHYEELRQAFNVGGKVGYWTKLRNLGGTSTNHFLDHYWIPQATAHLGDYPRALELLEKYYETNTMESLEWLFYDEVWDPVHEDPRFVALLKRTGLRP